MACGNIIPYTQVRKVDEVLLQLVMSNTALLTCAVNKTMLSNTRESFAVGLMTLRVDALNAIA